MKAIKKIEFRLLHSIYVCNPAWDPKQHILVNEKSGKEIVR